MYCLLKPDSGWENCFTGIESGLTNDCESRIWEQLGHVFFCNCVHKNPLCTPRIIFTCIILTATKQVFVFLLHTFRVFIQFLQVIYLSRFSVFKISPFTIPRKNIQNFGTYITLSFNCFSKVVQKFLEVYCHAHCNTSEFIFEIN